MNIRSLTYVLSVFVIFTSCASLQAARIDGRLDGNMYKIVAPNMTLKVGDKVALIKESYREYGRAHDANTVILNRTTVAKGVVTKILSDDSAAATFDGNATPVKGMKVEKI